MGILSVEYIYTMTERRGTNLSRKDFLKLLSIAGVAAGTTLLERSVKRNLPRFLFSFEYKDLLAISEREDLPLGISGVGFNAPYLWLRSDETIDGYFANTQNKAITRFLPDKPEDLFEPQIGEYRMSVLDKMDNVIKRAPPGHRFIVPIIDGYWLLHASKFNPMYGSTELNSPYIGTPDSKKDIKEAQNAFFTDPQMKRAYKNRAYEFIERFGERENVFLEIGNELRPPDGDRKHINSLWHSEMYTFIRKYYDRPLLTGVADPSHLDYSYFPDTEGLVTTDHIYYRKESVYPQPVPVIIEEIGVPQLIFNRFGVKNADIYLRNLIVNTLNDSIVDGRGYAEGLILWQADPTHYDNFGLKAEKFKETYSLIEVLSDNWNSREENLLN